MFSHAPGRKEEGTDSYHLSGHEILLGATAHLEGSKADDIAGVCEEPFVCVKVTLGGDGNAQFDPYQLSAQCKEMVAEGALLAPPAGYAHLNAVHRTFTAQVEAKDSDYVDTDFFLCNVAIRQHASPLRAQFPRFHRMTEMPDSRALRSAIQAGGKNMAFVEKISDANLLLFLAETGFEVSDVTSMALRVGCWHDFVVQAPPGATGGSRAGREETKGGEDAKMDIEEGHRIMIEAFSEG
jgi:hypothetical protein